MKTGQVLTDAIKRDKEKRARDRKTAREGTAQAIETRRHGNQLVTFAISPADWDYITAAIRIDNARPNEWLVNALMTAAKESHYWNDKWKKKAKS